MAKAGKRWCNVFPVEKTVKKQKAGPSAPGTAINGKNTGLAAIVEAVIPNQTGCRHLRDESGHEELKQERGSKNFASILLKTDVEGQQDGRNQSREKRVKGELA